MDGAPITLYFLSLAGFGVYELSVRWLDDAPSPIAEHGWAKYILILLCFGVFSTSVPANFAYLAFELSDSGAFANVLAGFGGLALPLVGRQGWKSAAKAWMKLFSGSMVPRTSTANPDRDDIEVQSVEETYEVQLSGTPNKRGLLNSYFG